MIGSVGGSASSQATQVGVSAMRSRFEQAMEPVAKLLDISADDLQSAFNSGQNLAQIAAAKGVSSGDLLRVVTQGLASAGIRAPAGSNYQTFVLDLINRPGGHSQPHSIRAAGSRSLAGAFGTSEDELVQALQSDTTLLQLGGQKSTPAKSVSHQAGHTSGQVVPQTSVPNEPVRSPGHSLGMDTTA